MCWEKTVWSRGGDEGGWRDDFPLDRSLPESIVLDCTRLELPIHPMFAIRLRLFRDWHNEAGKSVEIKPPQSAAAGRVFESFAIGRDGSGTALDEGLVLPVTQLAEYSDVEVVAGRTREILEYQAPEVSGLGQATFMAVAELCDNAIEHGANEAGAYVAVGRSLEPRRQVSVAIADLGVGIPEHVRQQHPEWSDDSAAIARATEPHVSGTGDPHRGNGFTEVFDAALTRALHAARIDIYSANGFLRTSVVQQTRRHETFPSPRYRKGTWIACDLISV